MAHTKAVRDFLIQAVADLLETPAAVTGGTVLIGRGAVFTSLELVGLLLRVEDFCREQGLAFSWVHDTAMSGTRSPYRTIDSLAAHITGRTPEGEENA